MGYYCFQDFLNCLEKEGELKKVDYSLSPYLEMTEVADRVMKLGGPALLFNNPSGVGHRIGTTNPQSAVLNQPSIRPEADPIITKRYDIPVAINTMGSRKRMSIALGCADFEEHAERIAALLEPRIPSGPLDLLQSAPHLIKELRNIPTKTVTKALCQEVVRYGDEIDLTELPILTCWPEDGGPFITLPLVFTHDPQTGKRNVGMYRMQLQSKTTCGMHWQMHKTGAEHMQKAATEGKKIEVAVVLGGDPAYIFSAISPLPPGIDEMLFAGFLRKENVSLVQCKTIDVKVPANAEIVLEGYVDPSETQLEGPFGDHTGYYSLAQNFPVFHCTCMTMRQKSVYPATIVGVPPMEDAWMGKAVERIFMPMLRLTMPELVDINLPVEACFHNIAFVSIKKKYPNHAYKIMNAIWGLGQLAFTKMVFVFDEDCDVQNIDEVLFRLGANCDPGRDVLVGKGLLDQLDHAAQYEGHGGKIGFDCTHKWPGENGFNRPFPKLIKMDQDIVSKIDRIWSQLGL
jgi:4-hydroxy-3-polyprenylbenzoate decarboxylase